MGVRELLGQSPQVVWGLLAVSYLFCIQTGAVLAFFCAKDALGNPTNAKALWPKATLALALAAAAPLSLVVELGQPTRAVSLFWRVSATSPLSYGVWCITALNLFSALFCLGLWRGRVARPAALGLGAAAVATLAYTLAEVNYAEALPIWSALPTSWLMLCSAVAAGYGLWLALGSGPRLAGGQGLRLLSACLGVIFCAGWLCFDLASGEGEFLSSLSYLLGSGRFLFFGIALGLGAMLPALLALFRARGAWALAACLLPVLGAACLRAVVVIGPQLLLRNGQGAIAFDLAFVGHGGLLEALVSPALALGLWLVLGLSPITLALGARKEPS